MNNIFYIYTTGICNLEGNFKLYINTWYKYILPNILKTLPESYLKVIINHYDPLELNEYTNKKNLKYIKKYLILLNKKYFYKKINIKNIFHREKFCQIVQYPHLIVDFANIYYNIEKGKVFNKFNKKIYNFNSIYLLHLSDWKKYGLENLSNIKLFEIDEDEHITTFYDKMIEKKIGKSYNRDNNIYVYEIPFENKEPYDYYIKDQMFIKNLWL